MSKPEWQFRVRHMLEAIDKVMAKTEGMDFEAFSEDPFFIDAVVRNIQVIGEAARKLPDAVRQQHPSIPRSDIIGMRNVIVHDYDRVDVELLWQTVQRDSPLLKEQLSRIVT